jgi:hypothetical protein
VAATSRKQLICDRRGGIPLSTPASSSTARRLTGVRVLGAVTEASEKSGASFISMERTAKYHPSWLRVGFSYRR